MSGKSGGDGGASKRAAADELARQQAREAVNRIFGIGSNAPPPVAPTMEQFLIQDPGAAGGNGSMGPSVINNVLTNRGSYSLNGQGAGGVPGQTGKRYDMAKFTEAMKAFKDAQSKYMTTKQRGDARAAQYRQTGDTVYDFNMKELDRNATREGRNLRFELARRGQTGGSNDIDQNQLFGELYDRGKLQARTAGDSAAARLRTEDEQTRLSLINSINAGTDASSAISGANKALQNNLDTVRSNALGEGIGNVFNDASIISAATRMAQMPEDQMAIRPQRTRYAAPVSSGYGGNSRGY
jgi:hypothetical protein